MSTLATVDPAYKLTPEQAEAGIAAYARYCAVVGTTWDNRPLPAWENLNDKIRKGWSEAGRSTTH